MLLQNTFQYDFNKCRKRFMLELKINMFVISLLILPF